MSEKIARSVVKDCLCISEDDTVLINTWQHMIDLGNQLALECRKIGAHTVMTLDTDTVFYGSMLLEPIESLKKPNKALLSVWDGITAYIFVAGPEDPTKMRGVPSERWAAMSQGEKPFMDKTIAKKKRSIYIMLGSATPQRAKTYGLNFKRWQKSMMEATAIRYSALTRLGKKIKAKLEKAKEVQILSRGAKLNFQLEGRPVYIYDGVIDEEDMKIGSYDAMLPAGAVSVAPIEASANGTVQFDLPIPQVGLNVQGLKWSFKNGKLTSFEGAKNVKPIKDWYEKAHGDKDKIGSLTLGINPQAKYGFLNNSIVQGAVSIAIGDNRSIGGKNNSDYMSEGTLGKATVKLDKKTFIRRGKFAI